MSCLRLALARVGADGAAEVLGGDDGGGVDRPEVGELDAALLEDRSRRSSSCAGRRRGAPRSPRRRGARPAVVWMRSIVRPLRAGLAGTCTCSLRSRSCRPFRHALSCRGDLCPLSLLVVRQCWCLRRCDGWVRRRCDAGQLVPAAGRRGWAVGSGARAPRRRRRARRGAGRSRPRSPRGTRTPGRRGEPQVGDLVELAQRAEDGQADLVGVDLGAALARTASSTRWPSRARSSSVTGRPWQALRTPASTLSRLNGSVAPERLTTVRLRGLGGGEPAAARRGTGGAGGSRVPSSVVRQSTTRLSGWRQNGQCIAGPPSVVLASACGRSGGRWCEQPVENRHFVCTTCGRTTSV